MSRFVKVSTIGVPSIPDMSSLPPDAAWTNIQKILQEQIQQVLPDNPDLIVLPEMCDLPSRYTIDYRDTYIALRKDDNIRFFSEIAKTQRCNIAFSTLRPGNGDYYLNTMYILSKDGNVAGTYDKNHLFPEEYNENVRCGIEESIVELDFGNVGCIICFDLNIDELRLRYKARKPEMILFSSMFHGGIMQQFWAQSCRTYVVSSVAHSWPSAIVSPLGGILAGSSNYSNYATATINLDYVLIHYDFNEEKIKALKNEYGSDVTIYDPGNLGYVMISSECDYIRATEMVERFDICSLDAYLQHSLDLRNNPKHQKDKN
jgi:predicted amidohydrolase